MGKTFGYIRDVVIIFLFMFAIGVSAYYWHNKENFTPEVSNGSESVNTINKVLEKQVTDIN